MQDFKPMLAATAASRTNLRKHWPKGGVLEVYLPPHSGACFPKPQTYSHVTFKYQAEDSKNLPRFPVPKGWRNDV